MAYPKPPGYRTLAGTGAAGPKPERYRPWNNFNSASSYAPGAPSALTLNMTFSAAPANGSQITVPDGPPNAPSTPVRTFTFTYSGSPGTGIIPLVAGGGTAAQAATAASVALAAQLTNWTVSNPASTVLKLVAKNRGVNSSPGLVGSTNITIATVLATFGVVIPARFGKNYAWLSGTPGSTGGGS